MFVNSTVCVVSSNLSSTEILLLGFVFEINLLISLFVPIMTIYFIYLIIIEKNNFIKLILIFFTVSVFYPTIFLGHLAPPRFEYVNLFSVYIMYPLIRNLKLR